MKRKQLFHIVFHPRFVKDFKEALEWSGTNAEKLKLEVERISASLKLFPWKGAPAPNSRTKGMRRVLVGRSDYHIYYTIDADHHRLEFVSLRHVRRRPVRL